jgi:P-type Ca2+ transporter type 2C
MMAMRGEVEQTPLQIQLNNLADFIAKGGLALSIFLFVSLIVKHFKDSDLLSQLADFLIAAITVVVVAVPEGLPMAVTLALAFATNRMLKDNNLVRVLASCETMGRVTSICSDKTGTLTENRMTVVRSSVTSDDSEEFKEIVCEGLAMNSTAFEIENEQGKFEFVGSATEAAILRFLKEKFAISYTLLRLKVEIERVIPFSSTRKLMISLTKKGIVHLKGAAEIVLAKCTKLMKSNGQIYELGEEELREIKRLLNEMNSEALRTIGQAFVDRIDIESVNEDSDLLNLEYCWLGVYGIEDPLRSGVKEAVATCQSAGIFVRMVTGDCRETAESIARRCGILMRGGLVLEGPEFRSMSDERLLKKLPKLQVLARSSPLDKQRLVILLKKGLGEIVAVTGDGSNDGPALKASDVGFSMGITGTQLAQEASAIVLLDDNFASIVKAASWGRSITRSVRKFLQFQLTVNVSAVVTAVVTALTTKSSVLTTIQMLWVNLLMDSLGALALATDLPTADLLQVPPERPGSPLITKLMTWQILTQAALQLFLCLGVFYSNFMGIEDEKVMRTFVFNLFVFLQLFNELNCRSISGVWSVDFIQMFDMRNLMFWTIWLGTILMQFGIIELGGKVFATVPLGWKLWVISVLIAGLSVPLSILVKMVKGGGSQAAATAGLHPTKEELAWQSAIHSVRTRARFYSAIRRKLESSGVDLNIAKRTEICSGSGSGADFNIEIEKNQDPFKTPELSPKSTDSLLLD